MLHTFHIDDSNDKAKALLDFLRTLEFVKEDNNEFVLTEKHLAILEERRSDRLSGKTQTHSWDDVKDFAENRKAV
ncbi:MAG: hypothetical protein COA38_18240 [Fluviicola sp.]|nr:MAG: hypothetical protein COA38_18240 [Fluviicola sp.]